MKLEGRRKFGMALLVIVMSFVLAILGKLDGGAWVTIATLTLGIFGAANVVDKKMGGQG